MIKIYNYTIRKSGSNCDRKNPPNGGLNPCQNYFVEFI